jgi:hypothetical protein
MAMSPIGFARVFIVGMRRAPDSRVTSRGRIPSESPKPTARAWRCRLVDMD